jgi:uncharacterized damage-inducible protein DinB
MDEIIRIVDQLEREYAGDPWHGSPVSQILDGVTHQQAARKPIASGHSIWELVLHMAAWKNEVRNRLSGAPAGEPEEGDWPPMTEQSERAWQDARERLELAHRLLVSAVRDLPETKLFEPTNDTRDREMGTGVTYYELLHGVVQHDVYHSGQIAILKKGV